MKRIVIALLLFFIFLFLSFNKHSKDNYKSYHSAIWADGAGYYVYNPIWFIYGNNPINFPDSIIEKTGNGFSFDEQNGRVITKYTSGVAILQLPFFICAHAMAGPLGFSADGFSRIYYWAIMVASCFYGLLGLYFSFLFLRNSFSDFLSLITVSVFFLATNLYYYIIDASAMPHVYSFFLLSLTAYSVSSFPENPRLKNFLLLILPFALAVLIRPTNIIFLLFILSFKKNNFFLRKNIFSFVIISAFSFLIFIPQFIYWKQSFGSAVVYSYGNESFTNKLSPKILEVWFSPNNGLFTYAPVLLVSIAGIFLLLFRKNKKGFLIGGIFLLLSYVFASWWNYWFGCSYGARSFVEYYPLLMFPFAFAISEMKNKIAITSVYLFCAACIWINFDMIYYYDGCFYGSDWDWNSYFKLLND